MKSSELLTPEVETHNSKHRTDNSQFPIVGIGASAGGLEALEQFFGNMPKDNGMAFVVIQHLDPTHVGIMPELLQRFTPMKVFQATNGLKVRPNCLYVIPPNKSMTILNGALLLSEPLEIRGLRLPIDVFFRSLAEDKCEKSIGIILSGMGSDGSHGAKAIKEQNGTVLVQSPAVAKFDGMPRSAIEAVYVDIVAPADELPAKLIAFLNYIPPVDTDSVIDEKSKSGLEKIVIMLREQTRHDFSLYKKNTLFRRIERRKSVHKIDKIQNYVRFCQENPNELDVLFKELLIGVTSFFRDTAMWESLKEKVLPTMLSELPNGYVLRAWVTACSTGEEAYSLAIIFKEVLENMKVRKNLTLQIFATDLDVDAIGIARKGLYSASSMSSVSPERVDRFFKEENGHFYVSTAIREMVLFATQNVIKDPPFTKLDLLTCRNMLIYMESELQEKVISLFNYSLNPGGILVLGSAETLGNQNEGFEDFDTKLKIYKRTAITVSPVLIDFPSSFYQHISMETVKTTTPKMPDNIQVLADQVLLQRFAPASVLVNENGDIIYITGRTGKYLEPVAGKVSWNIYAMAREGLSYELPRAFRKAMQNYDAVRLHNIKVGSNGETQYVDVTVQRIEKPEALKGLIMVVFADVIAITGSEQINTKGTKGKSSLRQVELELELQRCYEDLQSTREEMQTSQEELKSTNEELQSTNEELQSTNEELTTSKEEMQSLNEELQTVNAELQSKVYDFMLADNDMKNLLNSTEIATLFLDKELNIRRFTDQTVNIFKLRLADVGRPFTDLVTDLQYPEIEDHAQQVLKTLMHKETPIETKNGNWFNVRIMPYRTSDDRIDGLVITFTDITVAKKLEIKIEQLNKALSFSEIRYRSMFDSAKDGILILDAETGKIVDVNPFLIEMLGYSKLEFIEKTIWEIGFLKNIVANKEKFFELQQKEFVRYKDLPLETASGQKINVEFVSNVYIANEKKVIQCFIRAFSGLE